MQANTMLDFSSPATSPSPMRNRRTVSLVTMLFLAIAALSHFLQRSSPTVTAAVESKPPVIDPSIDQKILASFEDHSRSIDFQAYYYLLNQARHADPGKLIEQAASGVTYAQLLDDPGRYRGGSLHLRGRLFRLIDYRPQENPFGIEKQYEGWLYTPGAGSLPYCLIMANRPADIPMGDAIYTPVDVTGYFLGWWRYSTKEGKRTSAPIIAVCRIQPQREPSVTSMPPVALSPTVAWIVVASLVTWWWQRPRASSTPASVDTDQWIFQETPGQETTQAAIGDEANQPLVR
jgi:hypothetical protein